MNVTSAQMDRPVGQLLREWRERRRLSQLELSSQAEISTRHLSFVETGRSRPTPEMLMKITEHLDVPLRERNQILLAGGYAPRYPQHRLDAPELASVQAALRAVLKGHEPHPAVLINRWWEMLEANDAIMIFLADVEPELLEPPVNILRLSLHPGGLASRIANLGQWRSHLLGQVRRRAELTGDAKLAALHTELSGYPGGTAPGMAPTDVVLPLRLRHEDGELSFFAIAATVETAADVTVDELVIESFFPADAQTAERLRALVG
ncbi:helix-turn-helix domain-containing protein [Cryptosporangium sp. NPDC051539]|uniref:helix-turn-helix domain-containing protein n=1 Tax=Cryptosporangium sp. NPDC051539 TaxID=3363962 RepID=UPI00379B5A84